MINIPATDIMSLITGEVDKMAMADRPKAAEVSFMGVINAEGSHTDEQADVLGFPITADMADSVVKSANFAVAGPMLANIPLQIQQDAGTDTSAMGGLTNNGTTSPTPLVDDTPVPPAFAPYSKGTHSIMQPALPKATLIIFGPEPDPRSAENQSKTAVEKADAPTRNNNFSGRHTLQPNNTQTPRMVDAQPANGMLAGEMESPLMAPQMAPQSPVGGPGSTHSSTNTTLQQGPVGRADKQTAIAAAERFKPEVARLDKPLSRQQVAVGDHTNRKTIEQANQRPVLRSTNPGSISAGPPPSQRVSNPRHPAPQPPELPVSHTEPDTIPAAATPADKPPAAPAGIAIAQQAPTPQLHNIPGNAPNQRMSAQQKGPAQAPANKPDSPKGSAPTQTVIQHPIEAPIQSPERPPFYRAPPPAHPVNRGLENTPETQLANVPAPRLVAQYGEASKAVAPPAATKVVASEAIQRPTTSKLAAPAATQPLSNPDVSAPETPLPSAAAKGAAPVTRQPLAAQKLDASKTIHSSDDPMAAAFEPRQINAGSKGGSGDAYKIKSAAEFPAPKPARQNSPQQTGGPDITTFEAGEALATPEFVALEAKSAEVAPLVRHDANLNRPEVMRHVAQQLTDAARQMPDRPVELSLNPEELGRVRLTFTTTDAGLHVAVIAERGETMDLLRRHIESLAQDFRDLGYRDVKFDFSGNGARSDANTSGNENADQDQSNDPDAAPQDIDAPIQLSLEPSAGLDLRL